MFFRLKRALRKSFCLRFIYWIAVLNFVDLLVILGRKAAASSARKTVAFIKMDGIGDYVIWESFYPLIESLYPASKFEKVLVGNSAWQELASGTDIFERKIFVDNSAFAVDPVYRYRAQKRIRDLGASIALTPRMTRDFLWGDSMVRCSGAKRRIGSKGLENMMTRFQQRISDRWYTRLLPAPAPDEHELESIKCFLIDTSDVDLVDVKETSRSDLEPKAERYALLFMGASNADRRWSVANFAQVATRISDEHGLRIVIAGAPADSRLADEFALVFDGQFVDQIGKTTLGSLRQVIAGSSLVVSNDTGAAHMAVIEGIPTVVVAPGNQVGRYFPYPDPYSSRVRPVFHQMPCFGCGPRCIYPLGEGQPKPCIANVNVASVLDAIDELLGGGRSISRSASD